MMRAGTLESLVIMAVAVVGLLDAWRLSGALRGGGAFHGLMGPDTYLAVIATVFLLCGVWNLTAQRRDPHASPATLGTTSWQFGPVAQVVLVMLLYVAAFPILGYLLASFVFFPVVFFIFGVRPWRKSIVIGVAATLVFYALFAYFAELPLPRGVLDFIL